MIFVPLTDATTAAAAADADVGGGLGDARLVVVLTAQTPLPEIPVLGPALVALEPAPALELDFDLVAADFGAAVAFAAFVVDDFANAFGALVGVTFFPMAAGLLRFAPTSSSSSSSPKTSSFSVSSSDSLEPPSA